LVAAWLQLGCSLVAAWLQLGCGLVAAWLQLGCSLVAGTGNNFGGIGGGGDDSERQRKTQGQQAEASPSSGSSAKGGFSPQGFDRWINNPELSETTRNSLRKIKASFLVFLNLGFFYNIF
jgi:hypothetical protein